ncbi:MAG: UbiD family decarboxylase [Rhodospirillales bacterium]|nr:UbiD family decarboxylase [Rhodospirillales bacterium]
MPDQSFRSFLANLEQQGELIRFTKEVDPLTNMSAVEWKTYNELGKSSLFTNIKGHEGWTACSQILADRKKWAIGLGLDESDILAGIQQRASKPQEAVIIDSANAPVREVIITGDDVDLYDIPSMIVSELDGGRYMASGMGIVKDPNTGIRNISIHRQQIMGKDKTGFIMLHRQMRLIYDMYCERDEPMPVAMVYGAHPAIFFGSAFTTGFGVDELSVAGGLLGEPVRMVKCETIDMEVPAEAEMVIEGEILPNYTEPEGPFGEVPGTYAPQGVAEIFKVKAITRRKDPTFYALHCGFPVTETQATTALGIEVATRQHIINVEGGLDLLDVKCIESSGLMAIIIKLRPRVEGQAKTALMAALSGPYLHPKLAIAVDDDIDAADLRQVMWSMTTRVHAERDVVMIPNTRVFPLDNSSPVAEGQSSHHRIGTKWMIDATKPATTQTEQRMRFERAMPKNFDDVKLEDFLPG